MPAMKTLPQGDLTKDVPARPSEDFPQQANHRDGFGNGENAALRRILFGVGCVVVGLNMGRFTDRAISDLT